MATPIDNTEVYRMLHDFKTAIYAPSPFTADKFMSRRSQSGYHFPNPNISATSLAQKLNFSNNDKSTNSSLSSSFKEDKRQTPEALKRKLTTTEIELQTSRAALKEKEAEISTIVPANKKLCLDLEYKLQHSKKKNEIDQENLIRLESRLKFAVTEAQQAKTAALEYEKEKKIECNKLEMKVLALKQECSNMKVELSEVKSEHAEQVRTLNSEIGRLELKLDTVLQENTLSKEVIKSLESQVSELTEKASLSMSLEEELYNAQKRIKTLENKIEADEDAALVVRSRQLDLLRLGEFEKENRMLKDEVSKYKSCNVALFQEKMLSLQEKLEQLEEKKIDYAKCSMENEKLRSKIAEWEQLFDGPTDTRSPLAYSRQLSQYQKNEVLMANKISLITANCAALEKANKTLEATVGHLNLRNMQTIQSSEDFEVLKKRLLRRIFLLSKERDNCRKLIDSYVSETTMSGAMLTNAHIKNLEDTVAQYSTSLDKANEEIENLESQVKALKESKSVNQVDDTELKELKRENAILQSKVEELNIAKLGLELQLSNPPDIPAPTEKIYHLKHNPFEVAVKKQEADFQNLRDENDRLRKRVKILEEEGATTSDVTAKVELKLEQEGSETQLQSLKDQLAAAEAKNKLIIETARSKSREFREAVYRLMGYKVDMPVAGKYKLTHMYADSPDDILLFEVSSGNVNLLETQYSTHLTEHIETYLQGYDSVPSFLANLTLDLFKQQTYVAQSSTNT